MGVAWSPQSSPDLALWSSQGDLRIYQQKATTVSGVSIVNFSLVRALEPSRKESKESLYAHQPSNSIQSMAWSSKFLALGVEGELVLYDAKRDFKHFQSKSFVEVKSIESMLKHEKGSVAPIMVTALAWSSGLLAVGLRNHTTNIYEVGAASGVSFVISLTEATASIKHIVWKRNMLAVVSGDKVHLYDSLKHFQHVASLSSDSKVTSFTIAG